MNSNGNVAAPRAHAHDGPTPQNDDDHVTVTGQPSRARARDGRAPRGGIPSQDEQEALMAGVGTLLLELRKAVHLSQEAAAARAGISVSYLRRLEHGRRRPSGEMLAVLAVVYTRRPSDPMVPLTKLLEAVGASRGTGSARRLSTTARGHLADLVARERLVHGVAVRDRGPQPVPAAEAPERINSRIPRLADVRELSGPALRAAVDGRMTSLPDLGGHSSTDLGN